MSMTGEKTTNTQTETLSDIIRGMQHAVNTAQDTLADYQFQQLAKYFDEDGKPLFVHVEVEPGKYVNVPLVTLIPHNMLAIKTLEMEFSVKIASSVVKSFQSRESKETGDTQRSSFNVFFSSRKKQDIPKQGQESNDNDVINIKMTFENTEMTEASARIRELLYKRIG